MGKVWFTFGLIQRSYDSAAKDCHFLSLPEVIWTLIPHLSLDGDPLSGKPAFAALSET